jgi:hypothetical protein
MASLRFFRLGVAVLMCAAVSCSIAQSPSDNSVHNGVYRNTFLKREFTLPKGFAVVDFASLNIQGKASANEFSMLAAHQSNAPYGMIVFAERLNSGTNPIVDEFDFLRRIRSGWRDGEKLVEQKAVITQSGQTFQEVIYTVGAEWDAGVVSRADDYLIVWRLNAKSQTDLKLMLDSVHTLHPTQ